MYHKKILAAILVVTAITYTVSFTYSVGHSIDDGIHIVAAKALAMGEGLVMISDPASPPATQFPPAHSLFLVPVLLLFPDPPESTIPLQMVSALFALAFVTVSWFWLRRHVPPNAALLMTALVAFNPETLRFAGTVMAEMGYAAASLATLLFFEQSTEEEEPNENYRLLLLAAVMMTLAYLFRSVGVGLLLALPGLLILKRRFGAAAVLIAGFLILASPWLFKSAFIGTPEYRTQFWLLDLENPTRGVIGITGLLDRAWINAINYTTITLPNHLLTFLGSQRLIQFGSQSGLSFLLLAGQLAVTTLVIIGFIKRLRDGLRGVDLYMLAYGGMLLIWHTRIQWKYMAPITPIVLLYFYTGVRYIAERATDRRTTQRIVYAFLCLMLVGVGFRTVDAVQKGWIVQGKTDPYADAYGWLKRETAEDSLLMGFDHLGLYFYTGRKALAPAMTRDPKAALVYIEETGADYFIVQPRKTRNEGESFDAKFQQPLLTQYPERFSLVFEDAKSSIAIYRIRHSES